jgi:hypothetical protein
MSILTYLNEFADLMKISPSVDLRKIKLERVGRQRHGFSAFSCLLFLFQTAFQVAANQHHPPSFRKWGDTRL